LWGGGGGGGGGGGDGLNGRAAGLGGHAGNGGTGATDGTKGSGGAAYPSDEDPSSTFPDGSGGGGAIVLAASNGVFFSGTAALGNGIAVVYGNFFDTGTVQGMYPNVRSFSTWETKDPAQFYLYGGAGGGGAGGDGQLEATQFAGQFAELVLGAGRQLSAGNPIGFVIPGEGVVPMSSQSVLSSTDSSALLVLSRREVVMNGVHSSDSLSILHNESYTNVDEAFLHDPWVLPGAASWVGGDEHSSWS